MAQMGVEEQVATTNQTGRGLQGCKSVVMRRAFQGNKEPGAKSQRYSAFGNHRHLGTVRD
jgi:hypothetical protein